MKFKLLFLVLFVSLQAAAQISGYMGKRISVGYSNYFFPAPIGPTANADTRDGSFGFNTTHSFNLEYILKSRTVMCLSAQRSNTGMNPSDLQEYVYDGFSSYNYTYEYLPKPYKPMQITSTNIGLGFKFFSSGTLAPVGKYKKVELLFMMNHLTYSSTAFQYYDPSGSGSGIYAKKIGTGSYDFKTVAVTYTIGRSRVLFNRIVVDYGMRFGVVPEAVFKVVFEEEFSSGSSASLNVESKFRGDVNTRLFRSQMVNLHIGLSLLAL